MGDYVGSDRYIGQIGEIFSREEREYPEWLKEHIIETSGDKNMRGYGGNYVDINWIGEVVYIGDQFDEKDLDTRAKIGKEKLFKLIDEYYELLKSNPEHIVLYRDDDFNPWFETELPDFDKVKIDEKDRYKLYNPPDLE